MTIKMSEVFSGVVISLSGQEAGRSPYDWDCGVLRNPNGGHVADFDEHDEAQAAAHAINNHDKLVAENDKLVSYLKEMIKCYEQAFDDPIPYRPDWVKEVLNRT